MKMDRNWIVLGLLTVLLVLAAGCAKKPPVAPPPPPPPMVQTPPPEPPPMAEAAPSDAVEKAPPMTAQEIEENARRQGLLGDVFYDFDKYDLRPDARERLSKNAEFMNGEGRGTTYTIEGHCDERGTNEYNIALGNQRATAALDYLVSLGVARNRFKTVSYGEERPFCTQSTEECWQLNRRARFVLTGTGG